MCSNQACGCSSSAPIRYNAELVSQIQSKAQNVISTQYSGKKIQSSLLAVGNILALEILSVDESDKSSFLVFQKMGSFSGLKLEIKKLTLNFPKLEIEIYFKIDPLDGGLFKIEGTLRITCPDISHPSGCSVDIDLGNTSNDMRLLVNWDCLKNCAPQCISCGGNWQCWLGCAGGCIIQCL